MFDWEERNFYTWVFNSWAQFTCYPFFVPKIEFVGSEGKKIDNIQDFLSQAEVEVTDVDNNNNDNYDNDDKNKQSKGKRKGYIFACNHQSWVDIYSLCWLNSPLRFISKKEIMVHYTLYSYLLSLSLSHCV